MSSGVAGIDAVLEGYFWGDNVVWLEDGGSAKPFFRAIGRDDAAFDRVLWIAVRDDPDDAPATAELIDARLAGPVPDAQSLLTEVRRRCDARTRTLVLFESLDAFVERWSLPTAAGFLSACGHSLLGLGAIAYWSLGVTHQNARLGDTAQRVAQCVLRVDARRLQVLKAEGRPAEAASRVISFERHDDDLLVSAASIGTQLAASLRTLRRARSMSQGELARLAGVTASAISQAERGARGLSLETLLRIATALDMTLDDLVHGRSGTAAYEIGRRDDVPGLDHFENQLLLASGSSPRVELVRLAPRGRGVPAETRAGRALVAVGSGLVQVVLRDETPVLRVGEVLRADAEAVTGWRNLGDREATIFWITWPVPTASLYTD